MLPPWRRRPEAMSRPAEKERARNWEERKQQNSWAQGRPAHGRETSPNRTHNKTQGNHEVRALQQPPNAAHAERAISKHPPSLYKVPTYSTRAGAAPRAPGGARHGGGNRAVNSQPGTGQSTLCGDVKSSYGGAGGWDRRGCATWAPRSSTRQGEEQHRHTERGSHTRRDKGGHSRQGGGAQQGGRGNWNSGNREPEWSGWQSVRMGGSDNKGDGLASQPRRYRVPGQPLLNRHQVGGVSRSPDGLFAQQEWEPIRGGPTVRGKRTYGGRPGQRVEEQGTWAAQKHGEAGDGRPVDRGVWTAKTVKRPRQQPAHPQYANYWAPLTRKRHTMPHSAQSQHANYWAPRTRKRHQQEHRPQRREERVTVQGPVKEQQPDGMSHRGAKTPPYMGMGTLCIGKKTPNIGMGTLCTGKKAPIYAFGVGECVSRCGGYEGGILAPLRSGGAHLQVGFLVGPPRGCVHAVLTRLRVVRPRTMRTPKRNTEPRLESNRRCLESNRQWLGSKQRQLQGNQQPVEGATIL